MQCKSRFERDTGLSLGEVPEIERGRLPNPCGTWTDQGCMPWPGRDLALHKVIGGYKIEILAAKAEGRILDKPPKFYETIEKEIPQIERRIRKIARLEYAARGILQGIHKHPEIAFSEKNTNNIKQQIRTLEDEDKRQRELLGLSTLALEYRPDARTRGQPKKEALRDLVQAISKLKKANGKPIGPTARALLICLLCPSLFEVDLPRLTNRLSKY